MKPIITTLIYSLCLPFIILQAQESGITDPSLFGSLRARQIGPAVMSGRVSSFDVVGNQPEIVYVGAAGGGVWKSLSGGTTFRPVFDDHTQSIGKVAIDQNHPDTVWVGTGEPWTRNSVSVGNGVYKTTNGGANWQQLGLENTERISDILIHPENSDIVYVAALGHLWGPNEERGVYRTTDGGQSWEKILYIDEHTGATDLDIDPENPDILYAAMWSHRRRPWTFDSGFNGNSGVYKSTDGGENWDTIHNGLPDEKLGRMAIGVAPSNGDVIYLSVECKSKDRKGLYLSTDQGANWEMVSNEFNTTVRPFYFANLEVDPQNDSIVAKCGLQMIISEDRGERFRTMDQSVHSDVHDIWFNPNNPKHMLLGTDGGMYESFDRGHTFRMWQNLPISQFYRISVDDAQPYHVYGGLQDNGSWYAPSRSPGGISNADWKNTYGGDGFYSFRHPTNEDIIFAEYQGGELVRYNKKTGQAKSIKPYPGEGEEKYRFNWNTPLHLSPNNPNRIYFASQYLFVSEDMGDSWTRISPDLTTNDPEKQKQHLSGGLTIDNSTAENHCTIYSIAESPQDDQTIWAGTDDGNLQVSTDGGQSWTNVVGNVPDLPENTWVVDIEPSHHDAQTAYVAFDGHRNDDMRPYLYKTTDGGQGWTSLVTSTIEGYSLSVCEDPVNRNLLFLGAEFGLYISLDGGVSWARFDNNLPKVGVRDMVIHPRDHALVMGTHGRGVIILDDITPLRQISTDMLEEKVHFFATEPTILRDPGSGSGWFGGSGSYVGPNPGSSANIIYYMSRRHTFGKMYVEVHKNGELLKTLPAGKSGGINIVEMPTAMKKPKAAPTRNRQALFGSMFGPNLQAGVYDVKLVKGRDVYETTFELRHDPESPYSPAEREIQRATVMRLYNLTEQLAYVYHVLDEVEQQAQQMQEQEAAPQEQLQQLVERCQEEKSKIVAEGGDFYVDEEEKIRERISNLYRHVSSFPGKPSDSQLQQTDKLEAEMAKVEQRFKEFQEQELQPINDQLTEAGHSTIRTSSFEVFKEGGSSGSGPGSGRMFRALLQRGLLFH